MPTDRPDAATLLAAVRLHLQQQLLPTLQGAAAYDLRVAIKALDIVAREHAQPAQIAEDELRGLLSLLPDVAAAQGDVSLLGRLNATLCARLRSGAQAPDDPALLAHLRHTVMAKLAIDNPEFPLYRAALQRDAGGGPQRT